MKKKDWIYIVGFAAIFALVVIFLSPGSDKNEVVLPEDNASTTESEIDETLESEEDISIDPRYFDLLSEARDFAFDGKYQSALIKVSQASNYHVGLQLDVTKSLIYELQGDYEGVRDALYSVVYQHGTLEARYWRDYAHALIQTGASIPAVRSVYDDAIARMTPVVSTIGSGQLVDMYTAYASYLSGNEIYQEAISLLEKARELNPARSDIYNREIEDIQSKL